MCYFIFYFIYYELFELSMTVSLTWMYVFVLIRITEWHGIHTIRHQGSFSVDLPVGLGGRPDA